MIKISHPKIVDTKNSTKLVACISIDANRHAIWYKVDKEYGQFLTYERTDAFVVALLWYALKYDHDIMVRGILSERLYYTLTTHLIPIIAELHSYRPINIICDQLSNEPVINEGAVGTGLSCGIDSLSTLYENSSASIPEHYKITHCAFLNVGSNQDYGLVKSISDSRKKERVLFKGRLANATACAEAAGKKSVMVTSNLSYFLKMPWGKTHTQRNISAILALQKLFKTYYYSSETHLKNFFLYKHDPAYYDVFNLSMLSTETTTFFSSCVNYDRVQRTKLLANYPIAQKYLNVCYAQSTNCCHCAKCLVTLITLELLGELDKFASIFDLDAYYKKRNAYMRWIHKRHHLNIMLQEVYDLMLETGFNFDSIKS